MHEHDAGLAQVTADNLADYVYCPEAARLKALGRKPSQEAQDRMALGEVSHAQWQRQRVLALPWRSLVFVLVLAFFTILGVLGWNLF